MCARRIGPLLLPSSVRLVTFVSVMLERGICSVFVYNLAILIVYCMYGRS